MDVRVISSCGKVHSMRWIPDGDYRLFVWFGGAYIDVCIPSSMGNEKFDGIYYVYGEDCINVWDYGTDSLRIPFTTEAFKSEVRKFING